MTTYICPSCEKVYDEEHDGLLSINSKTDISRHCRFCGYAWIESLTPLGKLLVEIHEKRLKDTQK